MQDTAARADEVKVDPARKELSLLDMSTFAEKLQASHSARERNTLQASPSGGSLELSFNQRRQDVHVSYSHDLSVDAESGLSSTPSLTLRLPGTDGTPPDEHQSSDPGSLPDVAPRHVGRHMRSAFSPQSGASSPPATPSHAASVFDGVCAPDAACYEAWATSTAGASFQSGVATCFHDAAGKGDADLLRSMLTQLGSPRYSDPWSEGGTPLHSAVQGNSVECAELLLMAGADVNAITSDGVTPLMQAAAMGHEDLLLCLLTRHNASLTACNLPRGSENLLHLCVEHEMPRALEAILQSKQGAELARAPRAKPLYQALCNLDQAFSAEDDVEHTAVLCKLVDLLLPHSDMGGAPPPSSMSRQSSAATGISKARRDQYDSLIARAHAALDALEHSSEAGASDDEDDDRNGVYAGEHSDCDQGVCELLGALKHAYVDDAIGDVSTPVAASATHRRRGSCGSSRMSSGRIGSVRRICFTPTANLDCSPAHCSPISIFNTTSDCPDSSTPTPTAASVQNSLPYALGSDAGNSPMPLTPKSAYPRSPLTQSLMNSPICESPEHEDPEGADADDIVAFTGAAVDVQPVTPMRVPRPLRVRTHVDPR